jgi:putative ABC transport system ATP-binding protein
MNLRPQQLSGGEKQRVAIARAHVKRPSFIFADEPTSALDWENGQQVIELLNETARKGTTVLVVTHDPRLLGYAHQVFELADGKLMHGGAPANPAAINAHGHGATPALGHRHGSMAATHSCPTCRAATPYSPRVMLKDYYGQFANC